MVTCPACGEEFAIGLKPAGSRYEQRVRDARTWLEANWPSSQPPLPRGAREITASLMAGYVIQAELEFLREREAARTAGSGSAESGNSPQPYRRLSPPRSEE